MTPKDVGTRIRVKLPTVLEEGYRKDRLVFLRYSGKGKNWSRIIVCQCDCGNEWTGTQNDFAVVKSCGCARLDALLKRSLTHGHAGKNHSTEYSSWLNMKRRCCDPSNHKYPRYGGRGITICKRWINSFENFLGDMGIKPSPKHSIDRIDNDGNYEPENCRWATVTEQSRNTCQNILMTFNGQTKTISEWSEIVGIKSSILSRRKRHGWTDEKSLTEPTRPSRVRS